MSELEQNATPLEMSRALSLGHIGAVPKIACGKGQDFRVLDLWCHVWYTRFVGSREECEAYIGLEVEISPGMKNCLRIEEVKK